MPKSTPIHAIEGFFKVHKYSIEAAPFMSKIFGNESMQYKDIISRRVVLSEPCLFFPYFLISITPYL